MATVVSYGLGFSLAAISESVNVAPRALVAVKRCSLVQQARQGSGVDIRIRCDSMELAGEALQDLCRFLRVSLSVPGVAVLSRSVPKGWRPSSRCLLLVVPASDMARKHEKEGYCAFAHRKSSRMASK